MRRSGSLSALLLAVALALTGCGGGAAEEEPTAAQSDEAATEAATEEESEPAETEEESEAEESEGAESEGTAAAAGSGEKTAPGSTLAIGEPATVDYASGGTQGVVQILPTAIEAGDIADLAGFEMDEEARSMKPYYVRLTLTNVGDTNLEFTDPSSSISGIDDRGTEFPATIFFGAFDRCPYESAPAGFTSGVSYESCLTFLVPQEASIQGLSYSSFDTPYDFDNPVTWEQG